MAAPSAPTAPYALVLGPWHVNQVASALVLGPWHVNQVASAVSDNISI